MKGDSVARLQEWFATHCDGNWEHQYGLKIETLDNPGWSFEVDLHETDLDGKSFEEVDVTRSEEDWVECRVRKNRFEGYCGLRNLKELIEVFLKWAG